MFLEKEILKIKVNKKLKQFPAFTSVYMRWLNPKRNNTAENTSSSRVWQSWCLKHRARHFQILQSSTKTHVWGEWITQMWLELFTVKVSEFTVFSLHLAPDCYLNKCPLRSQAGGAKSEKWGGHTGQTTKPEVTSLHRVSRTDSCTILHPHQIRRSSVKPANAKMAQYGSGLTTVSVEKSTEFKLQQISFCSMYMIYADLVWTHSQVG